MRGGDDTGFFDWFGNIKQVNNKGKGKKADGSDFVCLDLYETFQEVQVRELAFWTAVNMIANAVSKCEFKTFQKNAEFKGHEYWRWNFSPNKNQNSSAFIHKLIGKLYRNNEVLVIERAGQLLVADAFTKTQNAVKEDIFSEILVEELSILGEFRAQNVLYLKLNHKDMYPMLQGLNIAYSKLMKTAQKAYQWHSGRHGKLRVAAAKSGDLDGKWLETFNELADRLAKPFLENENGIIPEFDGFSFEEIGAGSNRTIQNTRDIRSLIDDVYEITAKAFQIPAVLLKGEVEGTKDAIDNFLTFCIDPLCDQIQEEITRKQYGYEGFIEGDYLIIDTTKIRHFDLFANAAGVDKLISSGAFSINDIRIAAGETPIDAEWANKHFITKNYEEIGRLIDLGGTNGN